MNRWRCPASFRSNAARWLVSESRGRTTCAEMVWPLASQTSARTIDDFRDLVKIGIDFVRRRSKLIPAFAKFIRLMRSLQQLRRFPLNVIHNTPSVEAAMQADGNKSRLARHEPGALGHDR